jgi:hypothetical protein
MSKSGRPVDQRIRAMLGELGIKFTDQSLGETFYSMIRANGESGRWKIIANRRTVNRSVIRVVAIGLRMMIVPVHRNRAVMVVGYKRNLLAALPRRSHPGEYNQERTSDEDQAFHCGLQNLAL